MSYYVISLGSKYIVKLMDFYNFIILYCYRLVVSRVVFNIVK